MHQARRQELVVSCFWVLQCSFWCKQVWYIYAYNDIWQEIHYTQASAPEIQEFFGRHPGAKEATYHCKKNKRFYNGHPWCMFGGAPHTMHVGRELAQRQWPSSNTSSQMLLWFAGAVYTF